MSCFRPTEAPLALPVPMRVGTQDAWRRHCAFAGMVGMTREVKGAANGGIFGKNKPLLSTEDATTHTLTNLMYTNAKVVSDAAFQLVVVLVTSDGSTFPIPVRVIRNSRNGFSATASALARRVVLNRKATELLESLRPPSASGLVRPLEETALYQAVLAALDRM